MHSDDEMASGLLQMYDAHQVADHDVGDVGIFLFLHVHSSCILGGGLTHVSSHL